MTDEQIIEGIIEREGGFVQHPGDHGGATKFGITIQMLGHWRKRPVTVADVRELASQEAREIYRELYIERPGFQAILNPELRALVIDCGVQHGPEDAARWLQQAIGGLKVDGRIGPKTKAALEKADARRVYLRICAIRTRYYGELVRREPSQAVFAAGWTDRVADFVEAAPM